MACDNKSCRCCYPPPGETNEDRWACWLARQNVPADVRADEVLIYKYQRHPSGNGRAMWSPDVRKWCGFWPDGTPLTGCDEKTGEEVRWFWETKAEVLAVIRDALAPVATAGEGRGG